MPGLVAVVEPDVDRVRIAPGHFVDERARAFNISEITGGRNLSAGGRLRGGIHSVDVIVLITVLVLNVEDVLAVAAPEVRRDGPLRVGSDRLRRAEGLLGLLDPDVAGLAERFQESNVLPVRRNLRPGNLRIAEEQLAVNDGRLLRLRGERQNERECSEDPNHVFHRNLLL